MLELEQLKQSIVDRWLIQDPERYFFHIQFVVEIGRILALKNPEVWQKIVIPPGKKVYDTYILERADVSIVELICLLHDIGRGQEEEGDVCLSVPHAEAGVRISKGILEPAALSEIITWDEFSIILWSIRFHQRSFPPPLYIEEAIVRTADKASKIVYHSEWMKLCPEENPQRRKEEGEKKLDKVYDKIVLPEYKEELRPVYEMYKKRYESGECF